MRFLSILGGNESSSLLISGGNDAQLFAYSVQNFLKVFPSLDFHSAFTSLINCLTLLLTSRRKQAVEINFFWGLFNFWDCLDCSFAFLSPHLLSEYKSLRQRVT